MYIAPNYNITLQQWNHDSDHVHILFKAYPNTQISKFINAYKSASSRLLKKNFQIPEKICGKNISGVEAHRFRIYSDVRQCVIFAKTFSCVRFIYNRMLSDKIKYYQETKQKLNNTPAQYKKEFVWLKEVDSLALANAQINLQQAYNNFFQNPKFWGWIFPCTNCTKTAMVTAFEKKGNG